MRSLFLYALAGALIGAAQLHPWLTWAAWAGIAIQVVAVRQTPSFRLRVGGAYLGQLLAHLVTMHYGVSTFRAFVDGYSYLVSVLLAFVLFCVYALLTTVPFIAVSELALRFRWMREGRLWLPLAWMAAEVSRNAIAKFSIDWLDSQWRFDAVLRALGRAGWYPTMALCLVIAAGIGDAIVRRQWKPLALSAVLFAALFAVPPLPAPDLRVLEGIAAVHLESTGRFPASAPEGAQLIVWPESTLEYRPFVREGIRPETRLRIDTTLSKLGRPQLVGMLTKTTEYVQNSIVQIDGENRIQAVRSKATLMPLTEAPLLGVSFYPSSYEPGRLPPLLEVADRRIIPLVCVESFDRAIVQQGRALGGELIVVMSSDRPQVRSAIANRQVIAMALMRSVEAQLPLVRASLMGRAAFLSPDGRVLALSPLGTTGVLTWRAGDDALVTHAAW